VGYSNVVLRKLFGALVLSIIFAFASHAIAAREGNQYFQPLVAEQWGYNRLTLATTFADTSSIDINNTKAAGFTWYINNAFNNIANGGGNAWSFFVNYRSTDPSSFTISNGALSIDWPGEALNTCVWISGSTINGQTFTGGFYIDMVLAIDPAHAPGTIGWPSFWLAPVELLNGSLTGNFTELDGIEAFPGGSDSLCDSKCAFIVTNHYWQGLDHTNDNEDSVDLTSNILAASGTWKPAEFHHYSLLWVPTTLNGGTGFIANYIDGENVNLQRYFQNATPSAAFRPNNPAGAMFEMENMHFCLMIDAGQGFPVQVKSVTVWQP
jgi:hypothetical protein